MSEDMSRQRLAEDFVASLDDSFDPSSNSALCLLRRTFRHLSWVTENFIVSDLASPAERLGALRIAAGLAEFTEIAAILEDAELESQ